MSLLPYAMLFVKGTSITVAAWIVTACISLTVGVLFGVLSCNRFYRAEFAVPIRIYTFVAKGIPAYVQILIVYFVFPATFGISLSGFTAACSALAFCSGGYVTEIMRAGINAIPQGQWDACFVLGYSNYKTLRHVVFPQVIRFIAPALFGECEQLLKSTSLFATIGVTELTRTGMNIISRELNPFPVYMAIAFIYLFFSALLQGFLITLERRMRYGDY